MHLLIHSGVKPHKCAQCKKSFNQAVNLKRDLLTHSGEKAHQCGQCNFSTSQASTLRKHVKTHTVVRPHQCTHCDYSSDTKWHTLGKSLTDVLSVTFQALQMAIWRSTREELTLKKILKSVAQGTGFALVSDFKSHTILPHKEKNISSLMIAVKHFDVQDDLEKCNHKHVSWYFNKDWINCSGHFHQRPNLSLNLVHCRY